MATRWQRLDIADALIDGRPPDAHLAQSHAMCHSGPLGSCRSGKIVPYREQSTTRLPGGGTKMWDHIEKSLADPGLDSARKYLVEKNGITQRDCVFSNQNFEPLRQRVNQQQSTYILYILAHGCSDTAKMSSGRFVTGEQELFWKPQLLAEKLIAKGLPHDREARIKLCLCHSAAYAAGAQRESERNPGIFASLLAQQLWAQSIQEFKDVCVGGFSVEVQWDTKKASRPVHIDHAFAGGDDWVQASRIYYNCDAAGSRASRSGPTVARPMSKPISYDPIQNTRLIAAGGGGSKWGIQAFKPSNKGVKCCYFPFDYQEATSQ